MFVSEKRIAANRRNIELGREKSRETWHRIKERNQSLVECTAVCEHCRKEFHKMIKQIDLDKNRLPRFCSRSCANSRVRTAELKQHLHETMKNQKYVDGEKYPIIRYCKGCGCIMPLAVKTHRRYCSDECRISFKIREKNTNAKCTKRKYKEACRFMFDVYDYPDEFDLLLIQQYGWYSATNYADNPNGVSRDHMYSVSAGYKNNIPASVIAHPANCRLLLQSDNFKKLGDCSITLDELYERIRLWEMKYGKYQSSTWNVNKH